MVEQDFGGVHVDFCKNGCKSMWFDWMELSNLDESNEGFGTALEEALKNPRANDTNRGTINCPICGIPMYTHRFKKALEVNVEECVNCGGFFLDSGELTVARDTHMGDEEYQEYLDGLMEEVPGYEEQMTDLRKRQIRTEAIGKYTKYIQTSHYAGKLLGS
jgi:Zn-finger nucleic acid-binding protein